MATPGEKVAAPSNPLADIATAINTIAGTKRKDTVTTSPGDTAALQQAIASLQGMDYNAMLESLLQKAGAQIPNIQAAYGRAVGARSSGNAGYAAALQQLIKETTMAAQEKIAAQQLQNQQAQIQAGQAIAQATKGTTQTTTSKSGTDLQKAAALLALFEGLKRVRGMGTGTGTGTGTGGGLTTSGGGATVGGTAAVPTVIPSPAAEVPAAAPMAATAPTGMRNMRFFENLVTTLTQPVMDITNFIDRATSGATSPTATITGEPAIDLSSVFTMPPVQRSVPQLNVVEDYSDFGF